MYQIFNHFFRSVFFTWTPAIVLKPWRVDFFGFLTTRFAPRVDVLPAKLMHAVVTCAYESAISVDIWMVAAGNANWRGTLDTFGLFKV